MSDVVSIHAARSAAAAAAATTPSAPRASDGEGFSAAMADASKRPKGEKTEKVAGHPYEKITAGPDKGEYLNRSGNARDGEAFRLVERHGVTFHVYGAGKDVKFFKIPHAEAQDATGGTPAA